jgi:sugar phosphate isomerase/epimerase
MKFGVADFGMNVWDGALFDIEERLTALREIGFDGTERLEVVSEADALTKAAAYRKAGMDFATCRGPNAQVTIQWTAGLGKDYVWTNVNGKDLDTYCRQVNRQVEICAQYGIKVGCHNHMGSPVESHEEVEKFLAECPDAWLIFDTAHLAGADGDCMEIAEKYSERIVAMHMKDWFVTNPEIGMDNWTNRGRFCELGAGNVGLDNAAVLRTVVDRGFDGWVHVEQDTHLRNPLEDLSTSREYLRSAGF